MPLAHRRICGLCGRAFAIVLPPDEPETERDKLCPDCARLAGAVADDPEWFIDTELVAAKREPYTIAVIHCRGA